MWGHPRGLFVLFFAEMWERFSFYGMKTLLVLYMVKALLYEDHFASGVFGAYGGFAYAIPLIGGMLADRFLGYRRAIVTGGVLMAIGHFCMAVRNEYFFYGALALIATGNGFFKPNISTLVGKLYAADDPRRDGAFTIFYMGINLGALLATFICGLVGEKIGWHYGFALAGVGMVAGLTVFVRGGRHLGEQGFPPRPEALGQKLVGGLSKLQGLYAGIVVALPLIAMVMAQPRWVQRGTTVVAVLALAYIVFEMIRSNDQERGRIFVLLVLMFFSVVFWSCFEQAGSSITLFTDRLVDRRFLAWTIPTTQFLNLNPLFIFLLGLPFSAMWTWLARKNLNPSAPVKFSLGLFQLSAGFLAMIFAASQAQRAGLANPGWIVLAYVLHTTGELCLSPVGLSTITKFAPARIGGLLMGMWFLSTALAEVLAGWIAGETGGGEYLRVFTHIVYFGAGSGVLLLLFSPVLKKLSYGVK